MAGPATTAMAAIALLAASTAAADPARWYAAKQIDYAITGVFDGRTGVDSGGDAHVKDRVELQLTTDLAGTLKGEIRIRNFKSEISDVQPRPPGCFTPQLEGPFEFYTLLSVEPMSGSMLGAFTKERTEYPSMVVADVCTGKQKKAARTLDSNNPFHVPTVGEYLVDPAAYRGTAVQVDESTGTFIIKNPGGWTWTFKATPR